MNRTFIHQIIIIVLLLTMVSLINANEKIKPVNSWQSPSNEILEVLNAPKLPSVWTSPTGEYLLLSDPVLFPPLSELASPVHKLAGIKVNPVTNGYQGWRGSKSPRLVKIKSGAITTLDIPSNIEIYNVTWTSDGKSFALVASDSKQILLFVGSIDGKIKQIENIALNPLVGNTVNWMPDQERLLAYRIVPTRGEAPKESLIPLGPEILSGDGATARSTYESRNLLETAHDDALFEYYTKSELVIIDPESNKIDILGKAATYTNAQFSPDGKYILVERLVGPWSHEVAFWRFASETEVWNEKGEIVASIASIPLANEVPIHGVATGPRSISWRPTSPHKLYWVEALDGGDPVAKVSFRDRLMSLDAPFTSDPKEIFKAEHRIQTWRMVWGEKNGILMLSERERMRRWRYTWLLDVDKGTSRKWFDLNEGDRYNNPGSPILKQLSNGYWVMNQNEGAVYFKGTGATKQGDRPFLDLKDIKTGKSKRLFRCNVNRYEYFKGFVGDQNHFVLRSESSLDVPNYYLATFGKEIEAISEGEATMTYTKLPITQFKDPAPKLRQIKKEIVRYEREDGVPLSFHLYLPPNYKEGTALPTVIDAYPMEYSNAKTAGQVRGSNQRFMRLWGSSSLYFLLKGYAVLSRTAMPMIGNPDTTYDTFVPQLVSDAEAAIAKAVEMGVTDPERVGIIGHSHGALMVANLLAHTDLFKAGIARSGSYNKTNQPFGFQSERRSLFKARETYINLSPTFFADQVNEPILIIHGKADSNPGTVTAQSEVFFEAVRGSGGTARLVLLPFEDHSYRARESVEHVLWEQFEWFDKYLKGDKEEK